jgi:hypothetical protein
MTVEERIKACIAAHPDWPNYRVGKSIRGVGVAVIAQVRAGESIQEPAPIQANIISLDKLKAKYDTAAAIQRELAKVPPKNFIYEDELRELAAGRDRNRFRRTVENNPELFSAHRLKVRLSDSDSEPKWIWGSEADILALKEIIER